MASKKANIKLQSDLDRCRAEQAWDRVYELIPQAMAPGSGMHHSVEFLQGEVELERYIDKLAVFPRPSHNHKEPLKKAKKHFKAALDNDKIKPEQGMEAHVLLAKLNYICANFDDALDELKKADLDKRSVEWRTLRTLRLVSEAHAIRALCLDKIPAKKDASKYDRIQREELIRGCFERSSDMAMVYLQEMENLLNSASIIVPAVATASTNAAQTAAGDKATVAMPTTTDSLRSLSTRTDKMGELMETAIQRVPIYYIRNRLVEKGIDCYRKMLRGVDRRCSQLIQQNLARQLAEVLLRGLSDSTYKPVPSPNAPDSASSLVPVPSAPTLGAMIQQGVPFMKNTHGPSFSPLNRAEEVFLLLLLSDSVACREAVLSRTEECREARDETLYHVKAVKNLLTLVLSTHRQYRLLGDIWEHAMKLAYGDSYIFFMFGLSLLCQSRFKRSAQILQESLKLQPNDVVTLLLLARLQLEHHQDFDEAISLAETALQACAGGWLAGRCLVILGLSHAQKAQQMPTYADAREQEKLALAHLAKASRCDSKDHLVWFHLALQQAIGRDISGAKTSIYKALHLQPEHVASVFLLALLLTSQSCYLEALHVIEEGLVHHPNHLGLIVLRMKLELRLELGNDALLSARELLLFWKRDEFYMSDQICAELPERIVDGYDGQSAIGISAITPTSSTAAGPILSPQGAMVGSTLSNGPAAAPPDSDDTASVPNAAFSEHGPAASTLSNSFDMTTSSGNRCLQALWRAQANVWMELGDMYLEAGRISDVENCIEEALRTFPSAYQALYLRGRVAHRQGRVADAKAAYLASLSLFPSYFPALRELAAVYMSQKNLQMAEKVLRDLLRVSCTDHGSWYSLGDVLVALGNRTMATQCYETAVKLEQTSPLMPYSSIPRFLGM